MKKILISFLFIVVLSTSVFAAKYSWIEDGVYWRVTDDETGEQLKNILLDVGDNVYFLDGEGKMLTGWWKNEDTGKAYFFDNNIDRNYGGMVFGLHIVDGYYRYFGADGSLATSDEQGIYKNVYGEYWADIQGKLYYNNTLMRDTSINKSEFYSNPAYYTDPNLNNYYLATQDKVYQPILKKRADGKDDTSPDVTDLEADQQSTGSKKSSASRTSGGTDYYVDGEGHTVVPDHSAKITDAEKYGPMQVK